MSNPEIRFKEMVEKIREAVLILQGGEVVYSNPSARESLSYSEEEIQDKDLRDLVACGYIDEVEEKIERAMKAEDEIKGYEIKLLSADDNPVSFEADISRISVDHDDAGVMISMMRLGTEETDRELRLKKKAIEEAPVGITVAETVNEDGDRPLVYANEGFTEVTGYPVEEILGEDCRFLQGEKTSEEAVDEIREAFEEEEDVTTRILNYTKGGEPFWNQLTVTPIYDESGDIDGFAGFQKDITKQVEYRQDLEEARDHLKEAQSVAGVGHWVLDLETGRIEWSDEVYRIFGFDPGEIEPTHGKWLDFIHPDDRERVAETVEGAVDGEGGGYEIDYSIVRPEGDLRIIRERGDIQYEDDEAVRMLGTVQDVTKEVRLKSVLNSVREVTQKILHADTEDELLRSAVESVSSQVRAGYKYGCVAIGILDDDSDGDGEVAEIYDAGRIAETREECDTRWKEIYTREYVDEVLEDGALLIDDVTQPPHEQHPKDTDYVRHGAIALELSYRDTVYGVMTLHFPAEGISEEERKIVDEIAHDISVGLYALESEKELEKEKDRLAFLNRIVRHDIRNDMNLVLGWGSQLRDHVDDEGEEYLKTILDTSQHVVDLTKTARDFVDAIEEDIADDLTGVDLSKMVTDVVKRRREAYPEAEFVVEGMPEVYVKANDLLSTVFRNLLNNAIQHNDSETPRVEVSAESRDGDVVISVADNGSGVPDSQKEEIFGRGEKGIESEGTGIGLYLVDTLVDSYDGDVWVEDNDPEGSVFKLRLRSSESS